MNKKMIRYIVGSIIMLEAALLLLPILTAIVYGEWNTLRVFAGSALFCIVTGALLRGKKPENTTIFSVEGYVSVALCWVALSICGAIPLCVSGVLQNPFDAFFEIVSGFTTTGSSVMQSVEGAPRAILMWRSFFSLGWRYGSTGIYAGTSSHGRTLQYASDEGREPWPICRKTGSEGQKYG